MFDPITLTAVTAIFKDFSVVTALGGMLYGAFNCYNWIKTKFTNIDSNVVQLTQKIDAHMINLRDEIKDQTNTLATALSEQRQDFRTFYAPTLLMMQQRQAETTFPIRAKKRPARKKKP